MKATVVNRAGGPEVLEYTDVETPKPKAGEALVKIAAIGVNYVDVYHRTGLYKLPTPFIPGAYAEYAAAPAGKLVKIPDGVDFVTAAAALLQGMTAHYLVTSTYQLK